MEIAFCVYLGYFGLISNLMSLFDDFKYLRLTNTQKVENQEGGNICTTCLKKIHSLCSWG